MRSSTSSAPSFSIHPLAALLLREGVFVDDGREWDEIFCAV
jgi:hypothetical protein